MRIIYRAHTSDDTRVKNGRYTETSLSKMLETDDGSPQLQIYEDLVAQWSAIFCQESGENLRNLVAHGLIAADQCDQARAMTTLASCLQLLLIEM